MAKHQWKRIDPTETVDVGFRLIVKKQFVLPNGKTYQFTTSGGEGTKCVATVALTPDNQVIIARQFRVGPEKIMDEIPGGGVETSDVDCEAAARRELAEETGYVAGQMKELGTIHKDAYMNSEWHYFLATDCVKRAEGQELDVNEVIEVVLVSIDQLLRNAKSDRMTDTEAVFLALSELTARQSA